MGVGKSKDEEQQPGVGKPKKQEQTKHVRLLVLHNNSQQPQPGTNRLRNALETYPQAGSIKVDKTKIVKIPDNGQFPESVKNEITSWMSGGRIVIVCLMSHYDVQANFGNDNIVFPFNNPTASIREIQGSLDDLATTIKGRSGTFG